MSVHYSAKPRNSTGGVHTSQERGLHANMDSNTEEVKSILQMDQI